MNKIDCAIIEDLIPLYQEKLTSEKTNQAIKDHIASCQSCRMKLSFMDNAAGIAREDSIEEDEKSINYLKKVKNKNRLAILGVIVGILLSGFVNAFFIGKKVNAEEIRVSTESVINNDKINFKGDLVDDGYKLKGINFEEKGESLYIKASKVRTLPLVDKDNKFEASYKDGKFKEVYFNDELIWQEGLMIDSRVRELADTRVTYLGDNSAVLNLLWSTELAREFGDFKIQLFTTDYPFGLQINLEDKLPLKDDTEQRKRLEQYASFFFSMIDNADFVRINYQLEGSQRAKEVYVDQKSILASYEDQSDVKKLSQTLWGVKYLMERFDIK